MVCHSLSILINGTVNLVLILLRNPCICFVTDHFFYFSCDNEFSCPAIFYDALPGGRCFTSFPFNAIWAILFLTILFTCSYQSRLLCPAYRTISWTSQVYRMFSFLTRFLNVLPAIVVNVFISEARNVLDLHVLVFAENHLAGIRKLWLSC